MNLLTWIIASILEMLRHVYIQKKKRKSPNKLLSYCIRFAVAAPLVWFDPLPWSDKIFCYVIVGWWIHDYLQNIVMRRPLPYLNSTGWIDKLQNNYPFAWFVWKTIFFIYCVGSYYFNVWPA